VLEQMQLHLDRLVEHAAKRFYRWRLVSSCAMLIVHERGSFLGDDSSNESPEKDPFSVPNFN
jgi:hypothetical protein